MARKRELTKPHNRDKRYVRRDANARFNESDDVGRSLAQERRRKAKTVAQPGEGYQDDRKPPKAVAPRRNRARCAS
jgi:hypothetical protein